MFRTGERLFDCNQCSIVFEPITNDNFANTSTKSAHVDYLLTLKENATQTAILSSSITSSVYTHKLPFLFPYGKNKKNQTKKNKTKMKRKRCFFSHCVFILFLFYFIFIFFGNFYFLFYFLSFSSLGFNIYSQQWIRIIW